MATPQYFKGDTLEQKFYNTGAGVLNPASDEKSAMFEDCYNCFELGEAIYDANAAPIIRAIPREVFREIFSELFNSFQAAGIYESYLTVFRAVFGEDVVVVFTTPSPGVLDIDISAAGFELSQWVADTVVANSYVFDNMVDDVGDNIVFNNIKGFETQYDLEKLVFEMVPGGIFTTISLTI